MSAFTGTKRLVRLALRRDRVKLPLWIGVIGILFAFSATQAIKTYGVDTTTRTTYALTSASSIVSRAFAGPLDGPDIGSIVTNETFLTTLVAAAFMSTLAVVRHTRQNEEAGRSELID
jgi:ABC-2 type transport system permease protein